MGITWELFRNAESWATISGSLSQILYFIKIPRSSICIVNKTEFSTDLYLNLYIILKCSVLQVWLLHCIVNSLRTRFSLFPLVSSVPNSGPDESNASKKLYCTPISITIIILSFFPGMPRHLLSRTIPFIMALNHLFPGTDYS